MFFGQGDFVRYRDTTGRVIVGAIEGRNFLDLRRWGTTANITMRSSNGTEADPLPVSNGMDIGFYGASGFDGVSYPSGQAGMDILASEAWTPTAHGCRTVFSTTDIGSVAKTIRWEIKHDGHLKPSANNTYDIADAGTRVRNIFTGNIGIYTDGATALTAGLFLVNQSEGHGANVGTLTNAPAAGNPAFWLPININGVLRWLPAW